MKLEVQRSHIILRRHYKLLPTLTADRIIAARAHIVGLQSDRAGQCDTCKLHQGPFQDCVIIQRPRGKMCSNCIYVGRAACEFRNCSAPSAAAGPAPGSLRSNPRTLHDHVISCPSSPNNMGERQRNPIDLTMTPAIADLDRQDDSRRPNARSRASQGKAGDFGPRREVVMASQRDLLRLLQAHQQRAVATRNSAQCLSEGSKSP
jgi:hypothetical protein